jgi:hypothetical protein
MGWVLRGERFDFDPKAATACARKALSATAKALKVDAVVEPGAAADPGLYVLIDDSDKTIAGFWLVFGTEYLDEGPSGAPDRTPPFVSDLLDAAVEEVWWKSLPMANRKGQTCHPVVVLEWPNFLAGRSTAAPPGVPTRIITAEEAAQAEGGGWMDVKSDFWEDPDDWGESPSTVSPAAIEEEEADPAAPLVDPWEGLPLHRSLVTIVKAKLVKTRATHEGTYTLIHHPRYVEGSAKTLTDLEAWMTGDGGEPAAEHDLGVPLAMPGGKRVGFPISGWLTKDLGLWPQLPGDVDAGVLPNRDVSNMKVKQFVLSSFITLATVASIVAIACTVYMLATPSNESSPAAPPQDAQPALSLCSQQHYAFVNEFRCQIRAAAEGEVTDEVCGDDGTSTAPSFDDLQAEYCGLLDRQLDGRMENFKRFKPVDDREFNPGHLAATQACFNVLDRPRSYAQPVNLQDGAPTYVADPELFLEDPALGIRPLQTLLADLNQACDTYRNRMEYQVQGGVLATHVGSPLAQEEEADSEPAALRRLMVERSTGELPKEFRVCFEEGVDNGIDVVDGYHQLCGEVDEKDRSILENSKIWRLLGGIETSESGAVLVSMPDPLMQEQIEDREDLISAYFRARFPSKVNGDIWKCHAKLTDSEVFSKDHNMTWDVYGPELNGTGYQIDGKKGIKRQLQLDAIITRLTESQSDIGVCWDVIRSRATTYQPVHPLLGEVEDSWISSEQQLCGQICATRYNIRSSEFSEDWVTPRSDLGNCVVRDPPHSDPPSDKFAPKLRRGGFEYLYLPWSSTRQRWMPEVTRVDTCRRSDSFVSYENQKGNKVYARPWREQPSNPYLVDDDGSRRPRDEEVWVCPTVAEVCAFNLIAQDYMPQGEAGFLVGGKSPKTWAGETAPASRIAGGSPGNGLAATAASNLSTYGRSRSLNTCGHAAVQCFTALMLESMGTEGTERYEWRDIFSDKMRELASEDKEDVAPRFGPWCEVIYPYLSTDGLPEGKIDYPCAKGVQEAWITVDTALIGYETMTEETN